MTGGAVPGLAVVKGATARFTWRDLFPAHFGCRLYDADRGLANPFVSEGVRSAVGADPGVGGLLLGNLGVQEWGCHFVMFTGQTCNDEQTVMNNGYALAATGAAHARSYVSWADPDFQVTFNQGGQFAVWLLRNDRSTVPRSVVWPVAEIWMAQERARRERLPSGPG